jgi:hypothetical protein
MENLIIQYPVRMLLVWTLLNVLACCLDVLGRRLTKDVANSDPGFQVKSYKKAFLIFLLWLGFGIGTLAANRQEMLEDDTKTYECLVYIGAFFFVVIGYLLSNIMSLLKYFVCRKEMPKPSTYSYKTCIIIRSLEFFGYSALILLSFAISENPILLGGAIGLAFTAGIYLLELTRKKKRPGK